MEMPRGSKSNVTSDINVTPFVDICLVLLIIFMVVTPMLQEGVQVNLPFARNTAKTPDDEDVAIVVALKNNRVVYIQKKPIARDQYLAEMAEIYDRMPEKKILIKADKAMTYGDVRSVMIETNEAGFSEVSLVTEKLPGLED